MTPFSPAWLGGYGVGSAPTETIFSRLEGNGLICLRGGEVEYVLVSLDSLFSSQAFKAQLVGNMLELGVRGVTSDNVLVVASHTHFAPMIDDTKPRLGRYDHAPLLNASQKIAEAVKSALNQYRSEKWSLSYGSEACDGAVYRRVENVLEFRKDRPIISHRASLLPNLEKRIPKTLRSLTLSADGKPTAVLWSWPCHAVVSPYSDQMSSDYPGEIRKILREHFADPAFTVLFFPDFCGDLRPALTTHGMSLRARIKTPLYFGSHFRSPTLADYETFCKTLKTSIISAITNGSAVSPEPARRLARMDVSLSTLTSAIDQRPITMPIAQLSLGEVPISCLGAEVCSGYTDSLGYDFANPSFMTGCFDDCFGYLPTQAQLTEGGYEVEGFVRPFSLAGNVPDTVEESVVENMRHLEKVSML